MRPLTKFKKIYVYSEFVDMRKAIGGLTTIVETELGAVLFNSSLFVFCSKSRKNLKMVYWDDTGFALWNKKLEKQTFKWLVDAEENTVFLRPALLKLLLAGVDLKTHEKLEYKRVC